MSGLRCPEYLIGFASSPCRDHLTSGHSIWSPLPALPSYSLLHLPVFYALTFAQVQVFPLQLSHTAKGPTGWFLNLLPGIAGFLPFEKSVATKMKLLLPEPSETQSWGSTKHVGG